MDECSIKTQPQKENKNKTKNKNKTIKNKDASHTVDQVGQEGIYMSEPRTQVKNTEGMYKVLYVRTGELKDVSRARFSALKGKVIQFRSYKVRIIGEITGSLARQHLKAQGLMSCFGIDKVVDAINAINQLHEYASSSLDIAKSISSRLDKRFALLLAKLFIECVSIFSMKKGLRLEHVVSICLSVYSLFDHFDGVLEAQGLETIFIASALPFLPGQIKDVIKHISMLSNLKVLDDFTLIHKLFDLLERFFLYICNAMGVSDVYKEKITRCFSYLGFGSKHRILLNIEKHIKEASENKRIFNNPDYRQRCYAVDEEFTQCAELKDWIRKNGFVSNLDKKWELHMKIVRANEEVSRVEPNLFVFEGPPSCGKSVLLNQVLEVLGYSKYVHLIPDINEGKDFYDSYNNEDVFYMDDIGQKGISQWRTIINMVSSVKMPLDCAEAKLKDTKFFSSHTIVATTNNFMHLGGLCKSDGISNTQALWRRGFVFDFSEVNFKNGLFRGVIRFRHYNLRTGAFENSFPEYFKLDKLDKTGFLQPTFNIGDFTDDIDSLRNWIAGIIKSFELQKRKMQASNKVSENAKARSKVTVDNLVRNIFFPIQTEENEVDEELQDILPSTTSLWNTANNFMNTMRKRIGFEVEDLIEEIDQTINPTCHDHIVSSSINGCEDNGLNGQGLASFSALGDVLGSDIGLRFWLGIAASRLITNCFQSEIETLLDSLKSFDFIEMYKKGITLCKDYLGWIISFVVLVVVVALVAYFNKEDEEKETLDGQGDFSSDASSEHTSVAMMLNSVFECNLKDLDVEVSCNCFISGRLIFLPSHLTPNDITRIKLYRNKAKNVVWLEYTEVSLVYRRDEFDLAVFSLPNTFPNPFKNVSQWINKQANQKEVIYLISGEGFRRIDAYCDYNKVVNYNFRFGDLEIQRKTRPEYLKYDYQRFGLCGSIVFSTTRGFLGMHVAGEVTRNFGVASIFSKEILQDLRILAEQDKPLIPLNFEFSTVEKENTSVMRFYDTGLASYSPTATNIVPSALYGIYEVNRFPADLNLFGRDTLKEVSKKSFTPCVSLKIGELDFCSKVLDTILTPFGELSDIEIIKGTELLAGLNKDSSNGFKMDKDKTLYIDFENGSCTDYFKDIIKEITEKSHNGVVEWKHLIWVECLKDELRNEEKEGVPRSFRIGTLTQQFLMKKYFGKFVEHIMNNRTFNKIMVGCNPIKEWGVIYEAMKTGKVFAGDIKNWDGSMNAEIQSLVAKKLLANSTSPDKNLITALLSTLTNSLVVVGNDTYLTTHSMPSGSYLTAIMNSLVNKLYTAIWYYRNVKKPTVQDYWDSIDDFVYGDDKLNVIRKHEKDLNAITMKQFFESVNMGFTDSLKKPIDTPFQSIEEVTFLKRSFRYHNLLKKIVCPLELRVIHNTLSYYDCNKDHQLVLKDKINAAQREFYLHPERDILLRDFYGRLSNFQVPYVKLSKEYLLTVYSDDKYVIPLSFGGEQYF